MIMEREIDISEEGRLFKNLSLMFGHLTFLFITYSFINLKSITSLTILNHNL